MRRKSGKAKSGTWVTRELLNSRAFWALSGTAKGILFQFLLKRNMDKQHKCLNQRKITMTYLELENLFSSNEKQHLTGRSIYVQSGLPTGLSRGSIARGFKDLMAKGFIEIVSQGGAYQKDKTIYGITDDWKSWIPGVVMKVKAPGKKSGYYALQKKQPPRSEPYTPPQPEPKSIV